MTAHSTHAIQTYPGNVYVLSAPSGAGKSSLVRELLQREPQIQVGISHTTRAPRGQEQHGREYFFTTPEEFESLIQQNGFLEWAQVHGNYYGTSCRTVLDCISQGRDVLLEIDYQGALQVRRVIPHAVLIFILPPSLEDLHMRLCQRGEDNEDVISRRLHNAQQEMQQVPYFDYIIINDVFDRALEQLRCIVHAQRLRYTAQCRTHADVFARLAIQASQHQSA